MQAQTKGVPAITDITLTSWQNIVDLMAEICRVPAGLIMRITGRDIEVFVSSQTEGNPYHVGDREVVAGSGLYCEHVIRTRAPLHIPNAMSDAKWCQNPDLKLNMVAYHGHPSSGPPVRSSAPSVSWTASPMTWELCTTGSSSEMRSSPPPCPESRPSRVSYRPVSTARRSVVQGRLLTNQNHGLRLRRTWESTATLSSPTGYVQIAWKRTTAISSDLHRHPRRHAHMIW